MREQRCPNNAPPLSKHIRALLTPLFFTFLLLFACQAPPPTAPLSSQVHTQHNPLSPLTKNTYLVPAATTYSFKRPDGFNTLDYPVLKEVGIPPELNFTMNFPVDPSHGMPVSDSITRSTDGTKANTPISQMYVVLAPRSYTTTPLNRTIASTFDFGLSIGVNEGTPFVDEFNRGAVFTTFTFSSANPTKPDGAHFVLTPTPALNWSNNWLYRKPNPDDTTDGQTCPKKVAGFGNHTQVSGTLTLDHVAKKATIMIDIDYYGQSNYGNADWCPDRGHSEGNSTASLDMTFPLNYVLETEAQIEISASPQQMSTSVQTSNVSVTPTNKTQPWTVKATKTGGAGACTALPGDEKGSGDRTFVFPSGSLALGNGTYLFSATYDNDEGIAPSTTSVAVNIAPNLSVSPATVTAGSGQAAQFEVTALSCPGWELKITGTQESLLGAGAACSWSASGTGNGSATWDGTCTADDGGGVRPIAAGSYRATLTQEGSADAHADVTVAPGGGPSPSPSIGPSPDPSPSGSGSPSPSPSSSGSPSPEPTDDPDDPGCTGPCPSPTPWPPHSPAPDRTPKPPVPTIAPESPPQICQTNHDATTASDAGLNTPLLNQATLADTSDFNHALRQYNHLQNQRPASTGFIIQSQHPHNDEIWQQQWADVNSRISNLYFNIRDDLGYVENLSQRLAAWLQSRAGGVPMDVLTGDGIGLVDTYQQQFTQNKHDLNLVSELKTLYQETQLFKYMTTRFINQSRASKATMKALRRLNQQIHQHGDYISKHASWAEQVESSVLQEHNQQLEQTLQSLNGVLQELGSDFQTSAVGDMNPATKNKLRAQVFLLKQQIERIKATPDKVAREALMAESRVLALGAIQVVRTPQVVSPGSSGAIAALTTYLFQSNMQSLDTGIGTSSPSCRQKADIIKAKTKAVQDALTVVLDKITSNDCLQNADVNVSDGILRRIYGPPNTNANQPSQSSLDVLDRFFSAVTATLKSGSMSAFNSAADALIVALDTFLNSLSGYKNQLNQDCENPCPIIGTEKLEYIGIAGAGWRVCTTEHADEDADNRGIDIWVCEVLGGG